MKTVVFDSIFESQGEMSLMLFFEASKQRSNMYWEDAFNSQPQGARMTNGLGMTAQWFLPYGTLYKSTASTTTMELNSIIVMTVEASTEKECTDIFEKISSNKYTRVCYRDQQKKTVYIIFASDCPGPYNKPLCKEVLEYVSDLVEKQAKLLPNGISSKCKVPYDKELYLNVDSTVFVPYFTYDLSHINKLASILKANQINIIQSFEEFDEVGRSLADSYGMEAWPAFHDLLHSFEFNHIDPYLELKAMCDCTTPGSLHCLFELVRRSGINPVTLKPIIEYGK